MQEWKRWRIRQLDLDLPDGLRFVPCDFERDSLPDALASAGFDHGVPAFVTWLGVTQYLAPEAIMDTLRWVAELPSRSEILFTYLLPSDEVEGMKRYLADHGTRFDTFFTPEEIESMAASVGLRTEQFAPELLDDLYFRDRTDGLRAPTGERLITGRVDSKR